MKARLSGNTGGSTLEIVIAFAILVIALSGVITASFGNQSLAVDTQTTHEALAKARTELAEEQTDARTSFSLVADKGPSTDDIYTKEMDVEGLDECLKRVTSRVTWQTSPIRNQYVTIESLIADWRGPFDYGGPCSGTGPGDDDWLDPYWSDREEIDEGGAKATDIDATSTMVYLTSNAATDSKPDLIAMDALDPSNIIEKGNINTGAGLNAIDVAGSYAYVANDESTNQFQVIDVTNPSNPVLVVSRSLAGVDPSGSYPEGRSVYYYRQRAYIATRETAGPEFHVFDVSIPTNPTEMGPGKELNHTVNRVIVREEIISGAPKIVTYLATSANDKEIIVLDVTDPSTITEIGNFNAAGDEDGLSLFVLDSRLYLGRRESSGDPEFYILNIADPQNPIPLGSLPISDDVEDIAVSRHLAFLAVSQTNEELQIINVKNSESPAPWSSFNFSAHISALHYNTIHNVLYVANESNKELYVFQSH